MHSYTSFFEKVYFRFTCSPDLFIIIYYYFLFYFILFYLFIYFIYLFIHLFIFVESDFSKETFDKVAAPSKRKKKSW